MQINDKHCLYSSKNGIGCQLQENQKLKFQNNEHNKLNNDNESIQKFSFEDLCGNKSKTARKKLGVDSQLDTCYSYTVKNNHNQYLYDIANDTGSQEPKNRNLEIHNNEQTELKKISQTHNYINNIMADYLGINLQVARLLGQIYQDQRVKKYCYSSNRRLSDQCNISQRTVTNYVKKLQELGMINSEVKKIHKNRKVKSERTILLTNEFYEVAERCKCKAITRINKWEIARKPNKISKSQIAHTNNKYISKDIYKERKDSTVELKPKKKVVLKSYNLLIKEYVDLNFSSDKGLEELLKRFVRVQFKRNRRNDKTWFMLNDELKEHLDELLKLSKGCLLSACAIARLTVVQEWGKFYPLTKKKALHVDKFLQERMQPLFNQVRTYYNDIYGVQSIDEIYGINDGVVKEHKRFEDELSQIKTMVCDMRMELDKRKSLGICGQTNQDTVLIKDGKDGDVVEILEKKREKSWEDKYMCLNAANSIDYIDISPETGEICPTCVENDKDSNSSTSRGSASHSTSDGHLPALSAHEKYLAEKYGFALNSC